MGGRLADLPAIVTGGASGIGRAIAQLFAAEGAPVAVFDRDAHGAAETVGMITGCGGTAICIEGDVATERDVERAVAVMAAAFGRLDVLVNNAGIVHMAGAMDTTLEDWERVIGVNLRGVFLFSKHALPRMIRNGGGTIVNIASIGSLVSVPAHAAYNAAKAGVVGLSRQMAADYGPNNIRVNCVCPTATDTPLVRNTGTSTRALAAMAEMHPLRRLPDPEDIAQAVLFLASNEARCITGAVLPVDSGWTVI